LYDCAADPHEWDNLAAQPEHREVIAQLRRQLPKMNAAAAPVRSAAR
jgi:hypothetical protein